MILCLKCVFFRKPETTLLRHTAPLHWLGNTALERAYQTCDPPVGRMKPEAGYLWPSAIIFITKICP